MIVYLGGSILNIENVSPETPNLSSVNENYQESSKNPLAKDSLNNCVKEIKNLNFSNKMKTNLVEEKRRESPKKLKKIFKLTYPSRKHKSDTSTERSNSLPNGISMNNYITNKNNNNNNNNNNVNNPPEPICTDPGVLIRSKSESFINTWDASVLRTKLLQRSISRDKVENDDVAFLLEELMKIQVLRDPLLRKLFERNSRKFYRERLSQTARLNRKQINGMPPMPPIPSNPNSVVAQKLRGLDQILEEGTEGQRIRKKPLDEWKKRRMRWIGVNGSHDHHPLSSSSIDIGSPHLRSDGVPQTPHIIVSPENETQEPFFVYSVTDSDHPDLSSEIKIEDVEAKISSTSLDVSNTDHSSKLEHEIPTGSQSSFIQELHTRMSGDIIQIEEGLSPLENQITNVDTNKAAPYYSEFSADSSSSNSPVEDRPTGYFGNPGVPVVVPNGPLDFNSRSNTLPHVKTDNNDALIVCVSALYAKLLVVMGMAFPIAEIISNDVPLIFYNSFYLYLYFGSIFFLIYAYIFLLRTKSLSTDAFKNQVHSIRMKMPRLEVNWREIPMPKSFRNVFPKKKEPEPRSADKDDKISVTTSAYKPPKYTITETSNHGSMYLKMGAVLFGIGSMIYSGLEFGQYFELRSGADCGNILMAISPIARMIFTFLQMYFIFLNSRVAISKHTTIARFGLMHMIGTNLCIWLNVLVQETKHEIAHLTYNADEHHADLFPGHSVESHSKEHHTAILGDDHHDSNESFDSDEILDHLLTKSDVNHTHHNVVRRTVPAQDELSGCRRINLMGNVVSSASPFLFPCTIEYSLLCAGVLYVMWKNINFNKTEKNVADGDSDISTFIARKVRHHYSVDCARASRGLFTGIFILVLTIISLILFYVLISNDKFKRFAILEANIIELSIYSLAIISVIVGMKQMRELEFILEGDIELDNILLIIAQAGVYIYASFTIIGGYFSLQASHTLPLLTAVLTLIQTTLQTLFILDGSRRCCYTADQLDRKPGREMVTFLLVCNLAMWAISTFETSRADVHPTQLHFYGIWAWTIISHVSMPLAIFYRFHVTVCLGEIWKRSYKLKTDFMGL